MLIIDDGVFVDCNQSTLDMLAMSSKEELFSTHPAVLSPPTQPDGRSSFEKANEMIAIALENGSNRFDWVHVRKNGEEFPVEVLLTALPSDETTLLHVVWRDISMRLALKDEITAHRDSLQKEVSLRTQELEDALLESRLLGEAVRQSADSVVITNADGSIEFVNKAFTEINGYTSNEVIGKQPNILGSGLQSEEFYQDMWKTISKGAVWTGTLRNIRKNGEIYWARLRISPVKDDDGVIHHYIGIETDITDYIEAKERAEKANDAKSNFLSSMSHELRTPLNSIIGFSQLLQLDRFKNLAPTQKVQVDHILNAGEHLLGLINEVLDLAKVEAGKMSFQNEKIKTKETLQDCIDFSSTTNTKLNVTISDRTPLHLPMLQGDVLRFKQVMLNLISNAKKYNKPNGHVFIESEIRTDDFLRINVTDTGFGIPKEKQAELFVPFSRLGAENSDTEGTGIGLVLTKKIVEGMGGHMGYTTVENQGTTFWFELPILAMSEQFDTHFIGEKKEFALTCSQTDQTLLYVEDTEVNRILMENLVKEFPNLSVVCAETAHQGLALAHDLNPNMILMDINLPDMTGYDAFLELRNSEQTQDIPVVAISADAMEQSIDKAMDLGFESYLTKPFKIEDVVKVFNTYIRN